MKTYFNRIVLVAILLIAAVPLGGCCYLAGQGMFKCTVTTP